MIKQYHSVQQAMKSLYFYFKSVLLIIIVLIFTISKAAFSSDTNNTFSNILKPGSSQSVALSVTVNDRNTGNPIEGARAFLEFAMGSRHVSYREAFLTAYFQPERFQNDPGACEGAVDQFTDQKGEARLQLDILNCPTLFPERPSIYLEVTAPGYTSSSFPISGGNYKKYEIKLERLGFTRAALPLNIEYSPYVIDLETYIRNFQAINAVNRIEGAYDRPNRPDTLAWQYAFYHGGDQSFPEFIKKIESISSTRALSFLSQIINENFPLPNDDYTFLLERRSSEGMDEWHYRLVRAHVRKALFNIADDKANTLFEKASLVPEVYLQVIKSTGVQLRQEDYLDYISGKYVYGADGPTSYGDTHDALLFVRTILRSKLDISRYTESLYRLYQIADERSTNDKENNIYHWKWDRYSLTMELFELGPRRFTELVKSMVSSLPANRMTRKYLFYLYQQKEDDFLIHALKTNKELMKAYLAEDMMHKTTSSGVESWNEVQECLLPKTPRIVARIKQDVMTYMREVSAQNPVEYSRWLIRNMGLIDYNVGADLAMRMYKASPSDARGTSQGLYKKGLVVQGTLEANITALCQPVFEDIAQPQQQLNEFFRVHTIQYINNLCPREKSELAATGINIAGPTSAESIRRAGCPSGRERTYEVFVTMLRSIAKSRRHDTLSHLPLLASSFAEFFTGSAGGSGSTCEQTGEVPLDAKKALQILGRALNDPTAEVRQAALYAYSLYKKDLTDADISILKQIAQKKTYPENLMAAYSLSFTDRGDENTVWAVSRMAASFHTEALKNRSVDSFKDNFAFTTLVTLDLCVRAKNWGDFITLLPLVLHSDRLGRFDEFPAQLEKIVASSKVMLDQIIEPLLGSADPIDNLIGMRLAELKNFTIRETILREYLVHDDSFVRYAAAKYIVKRKAFFPGLVASLKSNTNMRVRKLALM